MLTHMSDAVLSHLPDIEAGYLPAHDGLVLDV
jgi:hypothetical protein